MEMIVKINAEWGKDGRQIFQGLPYTVLLLNHVNTYINVSFLKKNVFRKPSRHIITTEGKFFWTKDSHFPQKHTGVL